MPQGNVQYVIITTVCKKTMLICFYLNCGHTNIFENIVEAFLMGLINRYCSRRMNIKAHVPITRKYFPCKFRVLIEI